LKKGLLVCLGIFLFLAIVSGNINNNSKTPFSDLEINKANKTVEGTETALENEQRLNWNGDKENNIEEPIKTSKGTSQTDNGDAVKLVVSTNYGRKILFNKEVPIKGEQTILEVLEENMAVEKAYGGGFVNSIMGISSGYRQDNERMDWFYWVNGVMGNVGGGDYKVKKGDKIWWDYHPWSSSSIIPNVIGCFPEPFLQGYKGKSLSTVIICSERALRLAEKLKFALQHRGINSAIEVNLKKIPEDKIVIALGTWPELEANSLISAYNKNPKKVGLFVNFNTDGFFPLNDKGEKEILLSKAGAIVSLGSGLGNSTPLWLITATDQYTLNFTLDLVIEKPSLLENKIGLVTDGAKVYGLPWEG